MEESKAPLDNLRYFVEWGGRNWEMLLRHALSNGVGGDLRGKRVLEIGFRSGKMSSLFALMGADVVGLEVRPKPTRKARKEAETWGVGDHTLFVRYDGNLDAIRDESFDLIFTKSVLVVLPDMESFLAKLREKLKPGGRCLFLENGLGPWPVRVWRRLCGPRWENVTPHYFTSSDVEMVSRYIPIEKVRRTFLPPVCMIMARKEQ